MKPLLPHLIFSLALAAAIFAPFDIARAEGEQPYVYQRTGDGDSMSFTMQYEAGYGTRESRNFAQDGVEQGLRLRFQPLSFLAVEAYGGILVDTANGGSYGDEAVSIELIGRALRQSKHYINMDIGAGYIYDYRDNHIPRVRLTLSRSFDKFDMSLSGLLEIPVGDAGRDEADIMVSVAGSYGITSWYRQGFEVGAEDLEGLFEPEESEGGAKFLFGPTASFQLPLDMQLKLNASAVYAYQENQTIKTGDEWGFMGRLILGWSFK